MAQLLPPEDKRRPLAIMLLVIAAILIYWVCFHWFFVAHAALNEQIEAEQQQETRFRAVAQQREMYAAQIKTLRETESSNDYFLKEGNFNLAAADMQRRLKNIVNLQAEEAEQCQIISNQNVRSRVEEPFERVTVKVRMRCELSDLSKILFDIEGGNPLMFVDNVQLYRQTTRSSRRRNSTPARRPLEVRFDMMGYLRTPAP